MLGGVHEIARQEKEAEEVYRRSLDSDPGNVRVALRYLELLDC